MWQPEGIWNACFGSTETRETVLAEADRQSIAPQDYAMTCVLEAQKQGADFDTSDAFASLCRQLDIANS